MFGSVWECLGISRAAVVRFAERTGGVAAQLNPNEPADEPAYEPAEDLVSQPPRSFELERSGDEVLVHYDGQRPPEFFEMLQRVPAKGTNES